MRTTRSQGKKQSTIEKKKDTGPENNQTSPSVNNDECPTDVQEPSMKLLVKTSQQEQKVEQNKEKGSVENDTTIVNLEEKLLLQGDNVAESSTPAESLPESQSSSFQAIDMEENKKEEEDVSEAMREKEPIPQYQITQKVFARDDVTGLLYSATVRKIQLGPKNQQVNVHLLQDIDDESLQQDGEDAEETCVWHYFVHYHGWNVRWDRWVEEDHLYLDLEETQILAEKLKKEHQQLKKASKTKGRTREKLISAIQKNMRLLEEEHKTKHGIQALGCPGSKKSQISSVEAESIKSYDSSTACATKAKEDEKQSSIRKKSTLKKKQSWTKAALEKERKLRERDLEGKRRKIYADKINIPFGLKKELVDEWEIISQCSMVHNLPASVTVVDALQEYKHGKIDIIRGVNPNNNINGKLYEKPTDATSNNTIKHKAEPPETLTLSKEETEWQDMIEDIAHFFDDALQLHLLYRQEQAQCLCIKSNPTYSGQRFCEMYGCEYLLRLFVRLPSLLLQANIDNDKANEIFFKIGDFVRFLQKHQSRFFSHSYRKYLDTEIAIATKMKEGDDSYELRPYVKDIIKNRQTKRKKEQIKPGKSQTSKIDSVNHLNSNDESDDLEPLSLLVKRKVRKSSGNEKKGKPPKKIETKKKKKQKLGKKP